ncbi:MAG: alpha/beta fold hydrolase [Gammaproteobacteria bacterium]|nr:alpha/beta fold hydrolase [Gammaproteobacteria bacterium]
MSDFDTFEAGDVVLQSGITLRDTKLVYKTYGTLNADKNNVIVYPTRYGGTHEDNEYLIGKGMALDPQKFFIVIPNLLGAGLSSSPSNTPPPFNKGRFPGVTIYDNVRVQYRLMSEFFGIDTIALVVGWSMAAQQAYQWGCLYPDQVERIAPFCGAAKTTNHTYVFLEGVKAALTADSAWNEGWYDRPPERGLRAMARVWSGWALPQAFYRREMYRQMGYSSLEDFLIGYWEAVFLHRDANNILALIWTWQHCDLSANEIYHNEFEKALNAIKAKAIVMPGQTDLYFPPEDNAYEVGHMPNAELRVIPSDWGHYAGSGRGPDDLAFIDKALKQLLSS